MCIRWYGFADIAVCRFNDLQAEGPGAQVDARVAQQSHRRRGARAGCAFVCALPALPAVLCMLPFACSAAPPSELALEQAALMLRFVAPIPADRALRCARQQTEVPVLRLALGPAAGRCPFQHPCFFFTMYAGASTVLRSKGYVCGWPTPKSLMLAQLLLPCLQALLRLKRCCAPRASCGSPTPTLCRAPFSSLCLSLPCRCLPHQDGAALKGLHVDRQLPHHRLLLEPRGPAL